MPSYLVLPHTNNDGDSTKLHTDLRKPFECAVARSTPASPRALPQRVQLELPEVLHRSIREWLGQHNNGGVTGSECEVFGILVSDHESPPSRSTETPPEQTMFLLPPEHAPAEHGFSAPKVRHTLLSLPPELRNAIYHSVLVEPTDIIFEPHTPPPMQPALLRSCRQIRQEASGIYYQENVFEIHVHDFDATQLIEWCTKSAQHRKT